MKEDITTEITVCAEENSKPLSDILRRRGFSRRLISKLKRTDGGITRNGKLLRTVDIVYEGDKIVLREENGCGQEPNGSLNVPVLYEDSDLIVFDKPPFMPVHPSINHQRDTLGNYFSFCCPGLTFRPINRLDRDTGGCVLAAKNQRCAYELQKSFGKIYYGITPLLKSSGGRICAPIARERQSIILRCVREDGQYAATNWFEIQRTEKYSLCEFILETGRTHQIRVHMAHKGFPLIGDSLYGGDCTALNRQALHCGKISFIQPATGKLLTVSSKLPKDFLSLGFKQI